MSSGAVRVGDMSTGHEEGDCFFPPKPAVQGSSNTFINGLAVMRIGDLWETHCCGSSCHSSVTAQGSSTIFINGRAMMRIGDRISCHTNELAAQSSSNVFGN